MAAPATDLGDVAVVDNHCHAVLRDQGQRDVTAWRGLFTESPDPRTRAVDVASTVFYQRLVTEMALFHDVDPVEEVVLDARAALGAERLTADLLGDARLGGLVVDTGFPDAATALTVEDMGRSGGCPAVGLLRLEPEFERLVGETGSYPALVDAVRALVADARGDGWAGFKSVVGYRTGLAVARWSDDAARTAWAEARAEATSAGSVRLGHQPLLDTLLHLAFAAAAAQELPVQLHVGYGDPDLDLRLADPLLLRPVLEEPAYRGMPVVLLHGCWPYVREGAFLAAVYGNAWLDLSYGIPFLSRGEMRRVTRAALGTAPASRLMYSSDGARVPELHRMGAHDGRRLLGEALDELVADGDLTPDQAQLTGERVLKDNAWSLYGFGAAR
ncbi:Amidohydrolase [Friedmanniella luteola]|uniref:Amidohydrolase n=1 Tax=Friedmanniella luteola TaxID=546871 RepID=A0A1H1ZHH8_9ACTN|nr:amidohydrolase family protein [Friedmanniella luteola]SDT33144.1 Amidohydrolase [Friedmanniella luteola]